MAAGDLVHRTFLPLQEHREWETIFVVLLYVDIGFNTLAYMEMNRCVSMYGKIYRCICSTFSLAPLLAPFLASLLASFYRHFTDILPSDNHFLPSFYPQSLLQGHLRGHTGTFLAPQMVLTLSDNSNDIYGDIAVFCFSFPQQLRLMLH